MDKPIRKAVRCYLIKDDKVVVTKYKEKNKKSGYYDIPGGKIEDGETPVQTAIREMKEETGMDIKNLKYKGIMTIEYPDRKFIYNFFINCIMAGKTLPLFFDLIWLSIFSARYFLLIIFC